LQQIKQTIAELPTLKRSQLLDLWQSQFGRPAAAGIRRELLIPVLAYRIQERAYGGLKKETLTRLRVLVASHDHNRSRSGSRIKLGTRFVRQWRGVSHEVTVVEDGFHYKGATHKSLSEIARQITGTHWSGPLFFGLKKRASQKGGK
jgi:hypothetical protein